MPSLTIQAAIISKAFSLLVTVIPPAVVLLGFPVHLDFVEFFVGEFVGVELIPQHEPQHNNNASNDP